MKKTFDITEFGACGDADALIQKAAAFFRQEKYDEALEWYFKALGLREDTLGNEHIDTAETRNIIALVYCRQGEHEKALEWFTKALPVFEKAHAEESTSCTYSNIALMHKNLGEYDKALAWYYRDLPLKEKVRSEDPFIAAAAYYNIADVCRLQGNVAESLPFFIKACRIFFGEFADHRQSKEYREGMRDNMRLAYLATSPVTPFESWFNELLEDSTP